MYNYCFLAVDYDFTHMCTIFHHPQVEHQETGVKLQECRATDRRCNSENARMRQRIGEMEGRNAELRRRLADAQKYKEQVRSLSRISQSGPAVSALENVPVTKGRARLRPLPKEKLFIMTSTGWSI